MRYAIEGILLRQAGKMGVQRISAMNFQNINPISVAAVKDVEYVLRKMNKLPSSYSLLRQVRIRSDDVVIMNEEISIIFVPRWNHMLHWISYPIHFGVEKFPVASSAQAQFERSLIPKISKSKIAA